VNDAVTAVIGGTQLFQRLLKRLEEHLSVLPDKPDESPWNTLVCLWSMATGQAIALSQIGEPLSPLDHAGAERLENLVEQRLAGTPLAHLTGRQDFMNLVLLASPAALVPRRETEVIGYASLEKARKVPAERPLVVDLCTGAGNLALAIAKHCPRARVYGSDLSPEAVSLARENARFVGCNEVEAISWNLSRNRLSSARWTY
jgi:release factor glutamine methyltransferase